MSFLEIIEGAFKGMFGVLKLHQKGRFGFFAWYSLGFGVLVSLIVFIFTWLIVAIQNSSHIFSIRNFDASISVINFLSFAIDALGYIFIIHYLRTEQFRRNGYHFGHFLRSIRGMDLQFFLLSIFGMALFIAYFFIRPMFTDYMEGENNLNNLLGQFGMGGDYFLTRWLRSTLEFTVFVIPVLLVSWKLLSNRSGQLTLRMFLGNWKLMLVFFLSLQMFMALFYELFYLIDGLLFDLIRAPFKENIIPTIISGIFTLFVKIFVVMISVAFVFGLYFGPEKRIEHRNDDLWNS